jgi:Glyoxalase-like domain
MPLLRIGLVHKDAREAFIHAAAEVMVRNRDHHQRRAPSPGGPQARSCCSRISALQHLPYGRFAVPLLGTLLKNRRAGENNLAWNLPALAGPVVLKLRSDGFQHRVPEPKTAKNRVHFDLRAPGSVADEVARLERLGATVAERHDHHTVMRDPEGNELCVEPGPVPQP